MKTKFTILMGVLLMFASFSGCKKSTPVEQVKMLGWVIGGSDGKYGTIFHTDDGGATWIRQGDSIQLPNTGFSDVCIMDANTIIVVGESPAGNQAVVIKSIDGGKTWLPAGISFLKNVGYNCVFSIGKEHLWIVGDSGAAYYSNDVAVSWTKLQLPVENQTNILLRVAARNQDDIWIGTNASSPDSFPLVLHTTDGGNSWAHLNPLKDLDLSESKGGHILGVKLFGNSIWVLGGFGKFVIRSADNGATWSDVTQSGGTADANDLYLISESKAYLVTDYNGIFYTSDAGLHWTDYSYSTGNWYLGVAWLPPGNVWVVGSPGAGQAHSEIIHSPNGGNKWDDQTPEFFITNHIPPYKIRFIAVVNSY